MDPEEAQFWAEVHEACAAGETEEMRIERELWDRTVGDGPSDRWTDGDVKK